MIEELQWDSEFFGTRIGAVEKAHEYNIKDILEEKKDRKYARIYLFADEEIIDNNNSLLLVDEKITFSKSVRATKITNQNTEIYNGEINADLVELALLSGHESRFKKDPFFASSYGDLYKLWLENSLNRSFADDVIVAISKNRITGFITLVAKENTGHIGLIAVSNSSQGQGIGSQLIKHSDAWFFNKGLHSSQVVTQKNNSQACFFYKKNGYSVLKTEYIYHL